MLFYLSSYMCEENIFQIESIENLNQWFIQVSKYDFLLFSFDYFVGTKCLIILPLFIGIMEYGLKFYFFKQNIFNLCLFQMRSIWKWMQPRVGIPEAFDSKRCCRIYKCKQRNNLYKITTLRANEISIYSFLALIFLCKHQVSLEILKR